MTGLGALVEWFAAGRDLAAADGRRNLQDARLRALPREDIFLYVKCIDNSRVRCVEARSEWISSAAAALSVILLAVSFIILLAPASISRLCQYRMEQLKLEKAELLNENRILRAEEAEILSPDRLQQQAGERFVAPSPKDLVFAPPAREEVARLGGR